MSAYSLESAYQYCQQLARDHYENFPVASRLLPKRARISVAVIYAFARTADDFADEGDSDNATRLARLDDYAAKLETLGSDAPSDDPIFIALADVIRRHALPQPLFHDLLSAFRQDVTKKRYRDFDEVQDYCRRSANPVGRLLLHLHDEANGDNLLLSDKICSALQLINFLQDLEQDYKENGRIYLPEDEMVRFGVTASDIAEQRNSHELEQLLAFQRQRIETMMLEGARLGSRLNGRFGLEIRLIIEGGLMVLERLSAQSGQPFSRPRLKKGDYLHILWRTLQKRRHANTRAAAAIP